MSTIRYRSLDISRYREIMRFWRSIDGIGISAADNRPALKRFLARNRNSYQASVDGTIIGTILCGHDGRRGFIYHLAVSASFRKKGIAKTLIRMALKKLRAEHIDKCHIMVFRNNKRGLQFWKKMGWVFRDDLQLMSREIYDDDTAPQQC